jgi:histidyl-tRNA synthetase
VATNLIQRVPGTRDFYPDELRVRNWLFEKMRSVATRFGYEEYDGPLLEPYELFAAKSGDQLVGEEMYVLTDRGGRSLGIRPEMTPTLARMVAQRQRQLRKPIKWFSIPSCWRYERPQKGRLREHWQWNVDLLGVSGSEAEAEIIAVFLTLLREVGLTEADVRVRIGHRGWWATALADLGIPAERNLAILRIVDRQEKLPADEFRRQLVEAGLTEAQVDRIVALLGEPSYDGFSDLVELFDLLKEYGLTRYCQFDPSIVRGLAYYTSTVYEIWDRKKELRAIAGGGRYDNLTVALGGDPLPGAGMAMGDVVLGLMLEREGKLPAPVKHIDVYVACYSPDERPIAIRLCQELRAAGLSAERALKPGGLTPQLRQAEAAGARYAIILAPTELARGEAVVRDLRTGQQSAVALGEVAVAVSKGCHRVDIDT